MAQEDLELETEEGLTCTRRYVDHSAALETTHRTATACVKVLDVMPIGDGRADVVRRIIGVEGTMRFRHEWVVRFGYVKSGAHTAETRTLAAAAAGLTVLRRSGRWTAST